MSSLQPADLFSPEDKDTGFFFPSLDPVEDNFFDQCFNYDRESLNSSDNSNESNFFGKIDFGTENRDDPFVDLSPFPVPSTPYQPHHSWRVNSWRHHKSSTPTRAPRSQKLANSLRPEGAAISASQLLAIEGKVHTARTAVLTPPATPQTVRRKPTFQYPSILSAGTRVVYPVSKGFTESPKMMQPSTYYRNPKTQSPKQWMEQFQKFSLQVPEIELPLSPPPSTKVPQSEQRAGLVPQQLALPLSPQSPLGFQDSFGNQMQPPMVADHEFQSVLPGSQQVSSWMQPIDATLGLDSSPLGPEWPGSLNNTNTHSDFYSEFTSSAANQWTPLDLSFANAGLGINCGPLDDLTGYNVDPFNIALTAFPPTNQALPSTSSSSYSSSISPKTRRPRFSRSTTPSPPPHNSPIIRPKRRTRAKTPMRRKCTVAPRTPRSATGGLDFVNFTASDNQRILSGVAPSGSSKTKARREKEAIERRRKLNEVAVKVVKEAGGDVEALMREGLLV